MMSAFGAGLTSSAREESTTPATKPQPAGASTARRRRFAYPCESRRGSGWVSRGLSGAGESWAEAAQARGAKAARCPAPDSTCRLPAPRASARTNRQPRRSAPRWSDDQRLDRFGSGPRLRPVGLAHANALGRFSYVARALRSRILRFRYLGSRRIRSATRDVRLRVPAESTIGASRTRLLNGEQVIFSGRIRTRPLPTTGKLVEIQAYFRGRWRTISTVRASRGGAWRFPTASAEPSARFDTASAPICRQRAATRSVPAVRSRSESPSTGSDPRQNVCSPCVLKPVQTCGANGPIDAVAAPEADVRERHRNACPLHRAWGQLLRGAEGERSPDREQQRRELDVRNNDVRSKDIRNRTLRGNDVALNALGGGAIAESKLGQVPDSLRLGGKFAADYRLRCPPRYERPRWSLPRSDASTSDNLWRRLQLV